MISPGCIVSVVISPGCIVSKVITPGCIVSEVITPGCVASELITPGCVVSELITPVCVVSVKILWIFPLPNHSSQNLFVTSLMMPRIEETIGAYATGGIASPGQDELALETVQVKIKPLEPENLKRYKTKENIHPLFYKIQIKKMCNT